MKKQIVAVAASLSLIANTLFADASYTRKQTIKTGVTPQMTGLLKAFGGGDMAKALDPTTDVIMVHGNKMVTVTSTGSTIMDLDKQAWIQTDTAKREYYVMTFQQMSDMMERFSKMENSPTPAAPGPGANKPQIESETTVDISEEHTGTTREMAGSVATEHIFKATITTTARDATGKDPGVFTTKMFYTEEVWILDTVPAAYQQIQDFEKLMGERAAKSMSSSARAAMPRGLPNTPGVANGMVELHRRIAELKGLKVLEVTRISMSMDSAGGSPQTSQTNGAQTSAAPAASSNSNSSSNSSGSAGLGGLSGALARGALGGFGRKKTTTPPPSQDQTPASTPATTAQSQSAPASGEMPFLSETSIELGNFSTQPVSASPFDVPAGYKQVPSPLEQYMNSAK